MMGSFFEKMSEKEQDLFLAELNNPSNDFCCLSGCYKPKSKMGMIKAILWILATVLLSMWLCFATMGMWANLMINNQLPTVLYAIFNSGALVAWAYCLLKSIQGID